MTQAALSFWVVMVTLSSKKSRRLLLTPDTVMRYFSKSFTKDFASLYQLIPVKVIILALKRQHN